MKEISLKIGGMSCGGCAKSVTRALSNLSGVNMVDVDFTASKAKVTFDESQISTDDLIAAVEDAGFDASL